MGVLRIGFWKNKPRFLTTEPSLQPHILIIRCVILVLPLWLFNLSPHWVFSWVLGNVNVYGFFLVSVLGVE